VEDGLVNRSTEIRHVLSCSFPPAWHVDSAMSSRRCSGRPGRVLPLPRPTIADATPDNSIWWPRPSEARDTWHRSRSSGQTERCDSGAFAGRGDVCLASERSIEGTWQVLQKSCAKPRARIPHARKSCSSSGTKLGSVRPSEATASAPPSYRRVRGNRLV
jgi:hypothetical protein